MFIAHRLSLNALASIFRFPVTWLVTFDQFQPLQIVDVLFQVNQLESWFSCLVLAGKWISESIDLHCLLNIFGQLLLQLVQDHIELSRKSWNFISRPWNNLLSFVNNCVFNTLRALRTLLCFTHGTSDFFTFAVRTVSTYPIRTGRTLFHICFFKLLRNLFSLSPFYSKVRVQLSNLRFKVCGFISQLIDFSVALDKLVHLVAQFILDNGVCDFNFTQF